MLYLITAALGVGLAVALKKLRDHRRAVVVFIRPFSKNNRCFARGGQWTRGRRLDRLRSATNDLITEVAHLQRVRSGQLAQLETTLGSLQEAVLLVDSSNRILLANQALQAIFPRARDILNQRWNSSCTAWRFLICRGCPRRSCRAATRTRVRGK